MAPRRTSMSETFDTHSTLAAIYEAGERLVNTIHHQAVHPAPTGAGQWRVVGWGPGSVIEAIEARDQAAWTAIGVQWHPEKMREESESRLFTYFVTAAARYARQSGNKRVQEDKSL